MGIQQYLSSLDILKSGDIIFIGRKSSTSPVSIFTRFFKVPHFWQVGIMVWLLEPTTGASLPYLITTHQGTRVTVPLSTYATYECSIMPISLTWETYAAEALKQVECRGTTLRNLLLLGLSCTLCDKFNTGRIETSSQFVRRLLEPNIRLSTSARLTPTLLYHLLKPWQVTPPLNIKTPATKES